MRFVLKGLKERNKWSQGEVGRRLGIGQQAAGVILNKGGGFSRPTALKLAVMCGFDSPESMLADLGAQADPNKAPDGWVMRDLALGAAARLGYDDKAIERVRARYTESHYASQPAKWWMDRVVHEDSELAAERAAAPTAPPSSSSLPAAEPAKKRGRHAG